MNAGMRITFSVALFGLLGGTAFAQQGLQPKYDIPSTIAKLPAPIHAEPSQVYFVKQGKG